MAVEEILERVALYLEALSAVGERAPWRERSWVKVTVQLVGVRVEISESTR